MSEMKGKKEGTKEIVGPGPPPGPGPFPPVPLSHPAEYSIPALRHKLSFLSSNISTTKFTT